MTEEQSIVSSTPAGIEVFYSWEPRRHYKLRNLSEQRFEGCELRKGICDCSQAEESCFYGDGWLEVPSVTEVLDILDKPGLPWWGMKVGVEGAMKLFQRGLVSMTQFDVDSVVGLLTTYKLTVNHQRDKAADRGTAVHDALEVWAETGDLPDPSIFPPAEQGYVVGLRQFLMDVDPEPEASEIAVGSLEHGFAGRYDVRLRIKEERGVVFHRTPKRGPQFAKLTPGSILTDLKTSKDVYAKHSLQLEAYELASVECGYEPTAARGILNVTADGFYKFVRSRAVAQDFLNVLAVWRSLERMKEKA